MKIPDFKLKAEKDENGKEIEVRTNVEFLLDVLHVGVTDAYSEAKKTQTQEGIIEQRVSTLSGSQGRLWGRVQVKLDDAIEKKAKTITFETAEVDFLKKAIDDAKFPISWFRYVILISEGLDEKDGK